jgi:DNA-damage-inducible protein J
MTRTAVVRARVEPELKSKAESILDKIGVRPSDAIRMLYKQIVSSKGLALNWNSTEPEKTK